MGETDNINMDYVWDMESSRGQDRRAFQPNAKNALGHYQITPVAWEDLKRVYPGYRAKDYRQVAVDPEASRQAAQDYFRVLEGYLRHYKLPVTTDTLLAAYNWGIGGVRQSRGDERKYPAETRMYLDKYRTLNSKGKKAKVVKEAK